MASETNNQQFVYHLVPKNFRPSLLYPLNYLKHHFVDLYNLGIKKYEGRENLMEAKIPILNCLWNDVLHFSSINPITTIQTLKNLGYAGTRKEVEVFKININHLPSQKCVVFKPRDREYGEYSFALEEFEKFDPLKYKEEEKVPEAQIKQWEKDLLNKKPILLFSRTTHILFQGSLDVIGIPIIKHSFD